MHAVCMFACMQVVGGVFDVTLKTLAGLATSSTVKNMVTSFGDKVCACMHTQSVPHS